MMNGIVDNVWKRWFLLWNAEAIGFRSPFMGRQPGEWITGKPGYLMREFVICLYFSRYIYTVPPKWYDRTT